MSRTLQRKTWSAKKILYGITSAILFVFGTFAMILGTFEMYEDGREGFLFIILGFAGIWWFLRYDPELEREPDPEVPGKLVDRRKGGDRRGEGKVGGRRAGDHPREAEEPAGVS